MHKDVAVLAFTGQGIQTGEKIAAAVEASGSQVKKCAPARLVTGGWKGFSNLTEELEKLIFFADAFIFVGAAGIAVRAVAPFVRDKLRDPAVLVVDESGRFVIPLLSGHAGGANELARLLSERLSAIPVITTATDIQDVFSVDTFARQQHLSIVEKDEIKHLSGALLEGKPIGALTPECGFLISGEPVGQPFTHTLHLVPQDLVIGVGCRSGVAGDDLYRFVSETFDAQGWSLYRIRAVASVDAKKEETGLIELADRLGVPFFTYSAAQLAQQRGEFQSSGFVKQTVGVDNVCERSALCAAVCEGWLPKESRFEDFCLLSKHAGDGMTLAAIALYRTAKSS
ncbi:MAG: cobalt-precorrin 5A hydrolase [Lachnospiraceae bacterium]